MQEDIYPRWFNKLAAGDKPTSSTEANPYPRLIFWLVITGFSFLFLNSLWTWFSIAIVADESTIRSCLQEVAGPESSSDISDTTNQAFVQEIATSALQTALLTFLFTTMLVLTWLKICNKRNL